MFTLAEGLLRQHGGEQFEVFSAGTEATHVRPLAIQVMAELARTVRRGGQILVMDGDYASNQIEHPDRAAQHVFDQGLFVGEGSQRQAGVVQGLEEEELVLGLKVPFHRRDA